MERIFLAIACTLVHIPSIFIRYAPFREITTPEQKKKLVMLYLPVLAISCILYYQFYQSPNLIQFQKLMLVFVAFLLSGINVLVIKGHWREHWFTAGLASIHVSVTFFGCAYIVQHLPVDHAPVHVVAMSASITFLLFLVLVRFYCNATRRVVVPFLSMDSGDYWKKVWYMPLGLFFATFFAAPLSAYSGSTAMLLCRLSVLFTTIALGDAIAEDHIAMRQRLDMAEQLNIQQEYYQGLAERVAEARKNRHDFKHHMAAVHRFIEQDDKEGLTEYMAELQIIFDQTVSVPYTGNQALDGVFYRYATLAQRHNIRFDFSGAVEKLAMPNTDLCVLLGNALENAYTGCMTLQNGRFITVTARSNPSGQSLMISNSYDGVMDIEDDRILSRKRDHEPGIGLESMRAICEKHDAVMDIRYDAQTFNVLLIIPVKK